MQKLFAFWRCDGGGTKPLVCSCNGFIAILFQFLSALTFLAEGKLDVPFSHNNLKEQPVLKL